MRAVQRLRHSRSARVLARSGLLARGFLYLLLAYLAASIAAGWARDGTQANANGALTAVASRPAGWLALLGAAIGFAAFGVMRLAGSYGDRSVHGLRRLTTAGQAMFYLAMAGLTVVFLAGDRTTGSAQQQDSTAMTLVGSAGGRLLMAAVGVAIVCVCLWQLRLAAQGGFADSLSTEHLDERAEGAAKAVGKVGIAARAASVLPIGGLMVLAAAQARPKESRDLDQLLLALVKQPLGHVLVWVVTAGFLVFAAYSFLEVRYREVHAGD